MMKKAIPILFVVFALGIMLCSTTSLDAADVKKITKEELKPMLGSPDVVVVDVRRGSDWDSSGMKIEGAVREDPDQVEKWMGKYSKDKTLVFYCA